MGKTSRAPPVRDLQISLNHEAFYESDKENEKRIQEACFELIKEYSNLYQTQKSNDEIKGILCQVMNILSIDLLGACAPGCLEKLKQAIRCLKKKSLIDIAIEKVFLDFSSFIESKKGNYDEESRDLINEIIQNGVHHYSAIRFVIGEFLKIIDTDTSYIDDAQIHMLFVLV